MVLYRKRDNTTLNAALQSPEIQPQIRYEFTIITIVQCIIYR